MSERAFQLWRSSVTDRSAFEHWYNEANPVLLLQIYRMTGGDLALAEDLLHDVVVRFLERGDINKLLTEKAVKAYVFTAARNRYRDHLRRTQAGVESDQTVPELADETTPIDELLLHERLVELEAILSTEERATLKRMIDGKRLSEIANEEGLSYSHAGVRVHRIRQKIKQIAD